MEPLCPWQRTLLMLKFKPIFDVEQGHFCNHSGIREMFHIKGSGGPHVALGFVVKSLDVAILFSQITIFLKWLTVFEAGRKWRQQQYVEKGEASTADIQIIHGTPSYTHSMYTKGCISYWILNSVFASRWGVTDLVGTLTFLCSIRKCVAWRRLNVQCDSLSQTPFTANISPACDAVQLGINLHILPILESAFPTF